MYGELFLVMYSLVISCVTKVPSKRHFRDIEYHKEGSV